MSSPPNPFGGGGGGSSAAPTQPMQTTQTQTTTQKADPWSAQQPYLEDVFARAQGQANQPLSYYPGQTYAPASSATWLAISNQAARAEQGSPITGAYQKSLLSTLRGDYLNPASNPAYQTAANNALAKALPASTAPYEAGGRMNSAMAANAAGQGATAAIGQLNYDAVNQERQRQLQAGLEAPTAANQDYYDIAKLAESGGAVEGIQQQQIDDAVARYNYGQTEPWQRLALYNGAIQGNYGASTSGSSTISLPRTSVGANMLGGAATGAGIGNLIYPGGYGAAGGGLLGGLLGGLG